MSSQASPFEFRSHQDGPARRDTVPSAVSLAGMRLHAVREPECIEYVLASSAAGRGGWVVTPNLDILRRYVTDPVFAALIKPADLMVADGMPLIWASHLQGTPLPERVTGSSLVLSLSRAAGETGRSVFLLGGEPGTAEATGRILAKHFPGLKIAGWHCPPFGFEKDERALEELHAAVRSARPNIVYVALGSPKQERLIAHLRTSFPQIWWLGIGISFSYVTGDVRRAPRCLQRLGMEWLFRLCQEPQRLARRYLVHGIPFACRLLAGAMYHRFTGPAKSDHGMR